MREPSRLTDRLALLCSLLAVVAALLVGARVFENLPHIEDEIAYIWQARVFAAGELTVETPPATRSMLVPFVVDRNGQRFGKYPPGWPVVLAFGERFGLRAWINPVLAGLAVWLTYRLGRRLFAPWTALLASGLTLLSPFFLINAGSLLSHVWSLCLSLGLAIAWLDLFPRPAPGPARAWMRVLAAGLCLGLLALTRPLSAVGVALPFFLHGIWLLWRGGPAARGRVLAIGALAAAVAALLLVWQYAVTGDALSNPYVLWWSYDRIGFGEGVGRMAGGPSLHWAWINLKTSLRAGVNDLFGWTGWSWLFLPFGLWAVRRERRAWLPLAVVFSLVLVYLAYWIGASLYGPRYYFEGLFSLTLLTAAGIAWLARQLADRLRRPRAGWAVYALLLALTVHNLTVYLPVRMASMQGLHGISRERLLPFQSQAALALTPALIIVHPQQVWTEYGALIELEDPWLSTPFIFAHSYGPAADEVLVRAYPGRQVYHYYPDEPYVLRTAPR